MSARSICYWLARVIIVAAGLCVLYFLALFALLRFPVHAFPHTLQTRHLAAFSDQPIDQKLAAHLQNVETRLAAMPLHRPDARYRIFLAHDQKTYRFYASLVQLNPQSQGFAVGLTGTIFISLSVIQNIAEQYGQDFKSTLLEGGAAHIIAHEVAHLHIGRELGFWQERQLAGWLKEGFAEYSAEVDAIRRESFEKFFRRVQQKLSDQSMYIAPVRRDYLRAQLEVAYLAEIKKMAFPQLIQIEARSSVWQGILDKYAVQKP